MRTNRLWPGQFVETRLLRAHRRQSLAIPTPAVQHGPDGLFVYVVKPDSTVDAPATDRGRMTVTTSW